MGKEHWQGSSAIAAKSAAQKHKARRERGKRKREIERREERERGLDAREQRSSSEVSASARFELDFSLAADLKNDQTKVV